ncbi:Mini-ribonuclease 3 [Acetilactobacillus jinshanensis]|uniref:Mini-ribonuclease 3 n=1 Tax=Acetilactobacillus jinshanensis TaxID=1720083 RepID=A0A4P6ZN44_9LACO|nr:Mini-ribonuclease 3 [Acetilactobacillus jinshanensis]QBP18852.1 Mini-ribonuclease 3 [Acetilactobacillus jinshanensis]URL61719.1 Mini-ribonuclease 3 [uncultured bacterium]
MDEDVDYNQINGIALAYLGDAVYETPIRRHLLALGITKPWRLQKKATDYVSAKAQAGLIALMKKDNFLKPDEISVFKRGRNAKSHTHAKHTSVLTYRISTGFEAVLGYLELSNQHQRVTNFCDWCIKQVDVGRVKYEK